MNISIRLIDQLNPGFGYEIRILTNTGRQVLHSSYDPATGEDLRTLADALRVASYYVAA